MTYSDSNNFKYVSNIRKMVVLRIKNYFENLEEFIKILGNKT